MNAELVECAIDVAYGDPNPGGLPVSIGVPFQRGVLTAIDRLGVQSPGGEIRPAAARPLVTWPDGSIRWCLISFGAREAGRHIVLTSLPERPSGPEVRLTHETDRWIVDSDRLHVVVCETGPGILSELVCDGHSWLAAPGDLRFCVDDASTLHENRRSVRVIESTDRRVRLRVEGAHFESDGTRRLDYRVDVEIWAGWPTVRLDYHYFNREPGTASLNIRRIALDTDWQLGSQTQRHVIQRAYGLFGVSRHVYNPAPVAIAADFSRSSPYAEDVAMLLDEVDYPFYLNPPSLDTHEWLGVVDGKQAVYMKIQDFCTARPNRLSSAGATLSGEVWPSSAEMLDLPQGRSRRQAFMLAFPPVASLDVGTAKMSGAPVQAPKGVAAQLDAPLHEGRAAVDPAWIAHCGEFRQASVLPFGKHVRIENNLRALLRLDMPSSKFDVGDTDSHYSSSYSWINETKVLPLPGAPHVPRIFPRSHPTQTYLDLHEPVWTNNEYDVIHAFAAELMRTGRSDLWSTLRLAARHNIEVDFLHYSDHKWLHRATPAHSARHTTTGAYPSHFWTQGLLEYYCMSGDPDALEVALALGDKTIENFNDPDIRDALWGFNREIGWSILLLSCLLDVTGEQRFRTLLDEMVDYLVAFDREGYQGGINLSGGNDRQSLNRQIVGNFFGYGSMIDGIDLYAGITERADVHEWLGRFCLDLSDEAVNAAREGQICGINFSVALSVGYERTGDKRFLDLAELLLEAVYWRGTGVGGGGSVKSVASTYRGLPRLLGHAWRHGLLDEYEFPSVRKLKASE